MVFEKQGSIYQLSATLKIPVSINIAWEFLSNPANLKVITPDYMGFKILSGSEEKMYAGQIISYKVSPLLGMDVNCVTEITQVEKLSYFIDEQRMGPYAMWHHKHFLKEIEGGTEMIDLIHYKLPLSIIANRFHSLLVKPKLKEIFRYRTKVGGSKCGNDGMRCNYYFFHAFY